MLIDILNLKENNSENQLGYLRLIDSWNVHSAVWERSNFVMSAIEFITKNEDSDLVEYALALLGRIEPPDLRNFAYLVINDHRLDNLLPVDPSELSKRAHELFKDITSDDKSNECIVSAAKELAELGQLELIILIADSAAGHTDASNQPISSTLVKCMQHYEVAKQMANAMDEFRKRSGEVESTQGEIDDGSNTRATI